MTTGTRTVFEPRKTPVQARAAVTVDAISEATIQVLLSHGADRLTTRVADRAGVSVGTLYPYYPNKQSPLFAVMEDHFERVAAAVEASSEQAGHKPVSEIMIAAMSGAVLAARGATIASNGSQPARAACAALPILHGGRNRPGFVRCSVND